MTCEAPRCPELTRCFHYCTKHHELICMAIPLSGYMDALVEDNQCVRISNVNEESNTTDSYKR